MKIRFVAVRDPDDVTKAIHNYKLELVPTEDVVSAQFIALKPSNIAVDEVNNLVGHEFFLPLKEASRISGRNYH